MHDGTAVMMGQLTQSEYDATSSFLPLWILVASCQQNRNGFGNPNGKITVQASYESSHMRCMLLGRAAGAVPAKPARGNDALV